MTPDLVLKVIESFYEKAKSDILIGYHFRIIEDFDEHIPRIADFWNLQLGLEMQNKENLPFDLINVHRPLKINKGELNRWVKLFEENLNEFTELSKEAKVQWLDKVYRFRDKMLIQLF